MVSTGSLEIEHGDANEGVELLKQALEVDNAYHEPLLILSDLFRNEEDYEQSSHCYHMWMKMIWTPYSCGT